MRFYRNIDVDTPHGNVIVWRYMAHWKLEELITNSELFFPNATKLSDQYEVSIPESTLELKRKELKNAGLDGNDLNKKLMEFHWENDPKKDLVMINCWSISQHESYALWKIYLSGENNGAAIKSTVGALRKAVQKGGDPYSEKFSLGKVNYKTHLKFDELTRGSIITTKKPYYDFEKELRLFIINELSGDDNKTSLYDTRVGRPVKVDLKMMINKIYLSPFADISYAKELTSLLKANGIGDVGLKESAIRDK